MLQISSGSFICGANNHDNTLYSDKTEQENNMITRIFLTCVGLMYVLLALWCTLSPATTSNKVGFERLGGSGRSEFLVIYGGLELGLALVFLMPWYNRSFTEASIWACVLVHGCLVIFRTISYFLYSDISAMTHRLAIGEWVLFVGALCCLVFAKNSN
jgi:hypothetical protein